MTARDQILDLKQRIAAAVIGQDAVVEQLLIALLANGHVLLEGLPGLAKTRTIKTLAKNLESEFRRIQFTPDLLPSDITGTEIYTGAGSGGQFIFQPGPIFGNLILADEINRSPAKAQSALLEAMEERQVTVAGNTRNLPDLFLVLATQNPIEQEGKQDFTDAQGKNVDRLTAVKEVLDDFLAKRKGDRVGLIFFGSAPFVQAPFTEDLKVCRELLEDAQVNMAGPQTAFGDAIGLAITVFERSPVKDRVLIALTDGNDTASKVPPAKAAEIAKDKGIIIHTVAVGDPQAAGEDALDVDTLKNIASATGGLYAHAANREQLEEIYHKLDQLETRKGETISHRPRRDVYWWPLAAGLAISMLQHGLQLAKDRPRARPSSSEPNSDLRERERRTRKNERVTV